MTEPTNEFRDETVKEKAMAERDVPLTEKIENLARSTGEAAKRKIDAHVDAQTERFGTHVANSKARFKKAPGVKADPDEKH